MRRTQPRAPGPPPRTFATPHSNSRIHESAEHTTAAAGALKCRPSSFMRRVSTQPTDGCRGRTEVRASRKNGGKFALPRRRGRRRRKKARGPPGARGEPGAVRRIHEDPRGSTRGRACRDVATTSCMRTFAGTGKSSSGTVARPSDRKECEPFSTMCSYLHSAWCFASEL